MKNTKKILLTVISLVLVVACSVGGTLAYLTMKTTTLESAFTVGNVAITLTHTQDADNKMVPGKTLTDTYTVAVDPASEDCYVFIKVEMGADYHRFFDFDIADGWTQLSGEDGLSGVYYRIVNNSDSTRSFSVLANDSVKVFDIITAAQLNGTKDISFKVTAYACQTLGVTDAADAWDQVKDLS